MFDLFDKYPKCVKFRRLLYLFYSISHEKEFNAFMSEFSSGKVKTIGEITAGNKTMDILKYDNFDKIYNEVLAEFKKYYPDVNLETIPRFVVDTTAAGIKGLKVEIPNWLKEYDKDFKGFLYQMWKRIQLKKEKFIKKSSKIFHSRKLLEFTDYYPEDDSRNEIDPYGEEDWEGDEMNARKLAEEDERRRIEIERRLNALREYIRQIWWEFDKEKLVRAKVERRGYYNDTFSYDNTIKVIKIWGPMILSGYYTFFHGIYEPELPMEEENHLYLFFRNKWEEN
jgi:hypothetical protein